MLGVWKRKWLLNFKLFFLVDYYFYIIFIMFWHYTQCAKDGKHALIKPNTKNDILLMNIEKR